MFLMKKRETAYDCVDYRRQWKWKISLCRGDGDGIGGVSPVVECISNLVANELFSPQGFTQENAPEELPAHLRQGIRQLACQCEHLVIVSNEVGSDGIAYDDSTMEYIRIMGTVHAGLAMMAEEVYEVVYGIPLRTK